MQIENQNNPNTFQVEEMDYAYESEMQSAWDRMPDGLSLPLTDGSDILILSRGTWNMEAGPDFLNAKLISKGKIIKGDIEFHRRASDFIRHGHHQDPAYRNIILHVVADDDAGKDTPAAALRVYRMEKEAFDRLIETEPQNKKRCTFFSYLDDENIRFFLLGAGEERIREQAKKILSDMIATGSSDAFLKRLFQASGYKNNTNQFEDLFRRLGKYASPLRRDHFKAILWGESGLLPDPTRETLPEENLPCIRRLWEEYWSLRRTALPEIEWRRDALRPCNTPERRLAMLCVILEKLPKNPLSVLIGRLKTLGAEKFFSTCRSEFSCSDPFWDHRYTFRSVPSEKKTAVSSTARTLILFTDVLVPSFLAAAELENDPELTESALQLFRLLPSTESNTTLRNAQKRWMSGRTGSTSAIFSGAAVRQGCIHIYQTYCASCASDCGACLLANAKGI